MFTRITFNNMATPQQTQNGAASFHSISDKLAAIIYLLNSGSMTAKQIEAASVSFQNIADKDAAILYLLSSGAGGGSVSHGAGSPVGVITATPGALYINDTDSTLWAVANGAWIQLV